MSFLAQLRIAQGQLRRAAESYRQTLRLADEDARRKDRSLPIAGAAHVGLAGLLYEWNDLDTAIRHLKEGIALGEGRGDAGILGEGHMTLAEGYVTLARACQARGDVAGALDNIRKAEQHAQASNIIWLISKVGFPSRF